MTRAVLAAGLLAVVLATPARAGDETCRGIDPTWWAPTGVIGCTLDGATPGRASWYSGDVAATNWCEWPWTDCGWIRVQSHDTGLTITVPVGMVCGCYTGDAGARRLVDLTRGQVLALGLDPLDGVYDVTVTPLGGPEPALPDTALGRP